MCNECLFESSVIFNGTQTDVAQPQIQVQFESSVIFNGTQTLLSPTFDCSAFESSVIFNGTQTTTCVLICIDVV